MHFENNFSIVPHLKRPSSTDAYDRRFIFSGALVPKQIKRLLKMNGLSAVVARDAESVLTMEEAINAVRLCAGRSGERVNR